MPIKFKRDDVVADRYRIEELLNEGAYALSYRAIRKDDGAKVFFKQYSSPTSLVPWFKKYVEQMNAIRTRVRGDESARDICYEFLDVLERPPREGLCMVFEWVEGGKDLRKALELKAGLSWEQRLQYAKVLLYGVGVLHRVGVVHCDLKPENLFLFPVPALKTGFRLKIIDMDQSILSTGRAAWHGDRPYAGTPGYFSPEHLRQEVPTPASDAFTCAIILSELLGDGSPFREDHEGSILKGPTKRVALQQELSNAAATRRVVDLINRAFDPQPAKRPSVDEMRKAILEASLGATDSRPRVVAPAPAAVPCEEPTPALRSAAPPVTRAPASSGIRIEGGAGHQLDVLTDMSVGSAHLGSWSPDAEKFLSRIQFTLYRDGGRWMVKHHPDAANATLVDGKALTEPVPVADGTRLTVGNPSRGVEKVPLTLRIRSGA